MVLHILFMAMIISQVYGLTSFGDASYNDPNDLHIQFGTLRLTLRHGLHPALARMIFVNSVYYGQEFAKKRIESQKFIRYLNEKINQHMANGKVRLLFLQEFLLYH